MKKQFAICLAVALLLALLSACGADRPGAESSPPDAEDSGSGGSESAGDGGMELSQTGWTKAVPAEYTQAAREQGSVTRLDYPSEDYVRDGAAVTKTAYVYTPYGYDENDTETRYDILYLMHGWGGRAGEYFGFTETKNLFDNLIANGESRPSSSCRPRFTMKTAAPISAALSPSSASSTGTLRTT